MELNRRRLLSTTCLTLALGSAALVLASALPGAALTGGGGLAFAACKPCNPCNPCAAANPCNPCNPCAAANPCQAAAEGCPNPCNPCCANPCAAANPCNPCKPKSN